MVEFSLVRHPSGPCASNDIDFLLGTVNCNLTATTSTTTHQATTSTTTTSPSEKAETATSEEEPRSFYSCFSTGDSSSDGNAVPPDTTELIITYDYELHTSSPLNDDILSSFERSVAADLAGGLGLIDCGSEPERRYLRRSLQRAEVAALDSAPLDDVLDDIFECAVPVDGLDPSASCTPVRGYMTAYLPSSSSADAAKTEARLLTLIEHGMRSDSYTGADVVKAVLVGAPEGARENDDGNGEGGGPETPEGAQGDDGAGNAPSDGSPDLDEAKDAKAGEVEAQSSDLPLVDLNGAKDDQGPNLVAAKEANTGEAEAQSSNLPLWIGVPVAVAVLCLAVCLAVYIRRKRRSRRFTNGPDDMGNDQTSSLARPAPADTRDPDDVQLLPCRDKFDMRSVRPDDETSTSVETENHSLSNSPKKNKEANTTTKTDASDGPDASKTGGGAGSALAAMGVASTLAARSFPPAPPAGEERPSSPSSLVSVNTEGTPGAATVDSTNSHVGTVEEEHMTIGERCEAAIAASVSASSGGSNDENLTSSSESASSVEGDDSFYSAEETV